MNRIDNEKVKNRYASIREEAEMRLRDVKEVTIPYIYIGMATCGIASGAVETRSAFEETLKEKNIDAKIINVGCLGHCYAEPLVIVHNPGFPPICYYEVTPGKAKLLVKSFLGKGDPLFEYVLGAMEINDMIPSVMDIPRFNMEEKLVMKNCGRIDPEDIYHYIANDGYSSLVKMLSLSPEEIIDEIKKSGLRGRGGAGFPTARKLEASHRATGDDKYIICNADEGDPGAFQDRSVMEGDPHSLLEGMIIAGYAINAKYGFIYVRAEYPLAVSRLQVAINQARDKGFLGQNILDSGFDFEIEIFQGAGAFVCGESTALVLSIEGKRGMPKALPRARTTEVGLWDMPTVINNVKTLATLSHIIRNGGDWHKGIGTEHSPGTAIFSIVGNAVTLRNR